jgi:endonuclease-3 related protein
LARHGFVSAAADYHKTQEFLHAHLPHHAPLFNEFHALLVEVGKKHCKPQSPRCAGCPLEEFLPGGGAAQKRGPAQEPRRTPWQELQPA